jgi:hypothetical protein
MSFVPMANTAQFELRMLQDTQKIENTLMFGRGFPITTAQMNAFSIVLANWWATFVSVYTSTAVQLNEIYSTDLTTAIAPTNSYVPPTTIAGADTSPPLPNNVSLCASFRTANRGRSFRGRNYVAGLCHANVTANTVGASTVAAVLAAYNQLLTIGTATGWSWYVVSRFSGVNPTTRQPIPRSVGIRTLISSVVIVDPTVDNQQRRLPGRGR